MILLLKSLQPSHFACWDNIPGKDSSNLITFFERHEVKWDNNKTKITNDGQKITFSDRESSYSINLNKEKNIATIRDDLYSDGYDLLMDGDIKEPKSVDPSEIKEAEADVFGNETSSKQYYSGINWFSVKNENGKVNLYNPPIEKAEVIWVVFLLADKDKPELVEAIFKAIEDDKTILKAFFGDYCKHFSEYPFKLSDFQEEVYDRMLKYGFIGMQSELDSFTDNRNRRNTEDDL